jgi:hypothetical protein
MVKNRHLRRADLNQWYPSQLAVNARYAEISG